MQEIKVSLNIIKPGAVMLSKQECLKQLSKVVKLKDGRLKKFYQLVEDWDKMDKEHLSFRTLEGDKLKTVHIDYWVRKCKNAIQHLNLTKEQYDCMVSSCPTSTRQFLWNKMNNTSRLVEHLHEIAEGLGGVLLDYHIFED